MIDDKKSEMLDQLAAQAMNALMLRHGTRIDNDRLAEKAYEVAAAMMEHRTRIHEEAKRTVAAQQHNAAELAAVAARQPATE